MPIKFSKYQKTIFQFVNFFKNKIIKDKNVLSEKFQRMGLPYSYLIKNDWNNYLKETINSNRLEQIDFLEFGKVNNYLKNVISKKNSGYDQFAITIVCIDHFLKFIDEN